MKLEEEKDAIYTQMRMILEERRNLSKDYYELKSRLFTLDSMESHENSNKNKDFARKSSATISKEAQHQLYISERTNKNKQSIAYSTISLTIASILKGTGRPLSNKEIFKILTNDHGLSISYENLTHNILPRINIDSSINVERAYRGYWQYRLH